MSQETITIKFEPKGDKELIQSINALAKAQLQLENNTKALGREGLRQHESYKKSGNEMRKLSVKLKALGGDFKKAGVSGKLLRDALKGNQIALEKVRLATGKYTASLKKNRAGVLGVVHDTRILGGSFAVLRSKLLVTSFAIGLVERTFVNLVKAYGRQEAVNIKLATGLSNVQGTTEGVTQRLIDYSSALQKTTAIGDELITNGMVQLTTFNLNEEAIKALTPQVLNVGRALQQTSGIMPDFNSLFIAFGKSTSTAVSALTRYGIVLTDTEKAQLESMAANERAIAIAKILDKQYGGLSEAYAKTTIGMLEAADAARGDAAEAFGKVLAPMVLKVSGAMKELFEAMTPANIKKYSTAIGIAAVATTGLAVATGKLNLQLKLSRKALVRSGWGLLVVAIGYAAEKLLDFFGVFKDGNEVLTDADKRLLKIKEDNEALELVQQNLIDAQEKGVDSLQKQLDLLNAKSEVDKMLINLGHRASTTEQVLIDKIVRKKEVLEAEKQAQKDIADAIKVATKSREAEKDVLASTNKLYDKALLLRMENAGADEEFIELKKLQMEAQEALNRVVEGSIDIDANNLDNIITTINTTGDLTSAEKEYLKALKEVIAAKMEGIVVGDEETVKMMAWNEQWGVVNSSINNVTSAIEANRNSYDNAQKAKEITAANEIRNERKRKRELDKIEAKYQQKAIERAKEMKAWKVASAVSNVALGVTQTWRDPEIPTLLKWIMIPMQIAAGLAQVQAIRGEKFAQGGVIGGNLHSQGGTMIEAERGEFIMSRNAVESVGLETMNQINQGGGTGNINVSFSGNVMSNDFIENEAIPQIKEAIRRGADIGIA